MFPGSVGVRGSSGQSSGLQCRKQARAIVQVPIELEDMIVVDQGILCVQIRNGGV